MANLYEASNQWATRPSDQRFWTLDEMYTACKRYADSAATATVRYGDLRTEEQDGDLILVGNHDNAKFTNWSFGQLAARVGAPAGYLRSLPARMAADNVNHGIKGVADDEAQLLMHRNGSMVCRAFTSKKYSRIWNYEVIGKMLNVVNDGWRVPPAKVSSHAGDNTRIATLNDVLNQPSSGLTIEVGDTIAPAGLYASDHDCFAFLVNDNVRIDDGSEGGLGRGVFVSNSEVGASALKVTKFLYRYVCGNHIVWDCTDVIELKIVHKGKADERFRSTLTAELTEYANGSSGHEESLIESAKRRIIGVNKDEVLNALFSNRKLLPKKLIERSYESAEVQADGFAPNSVWGMIQGITHVSQDEQYADSRVALDRVAGKLMTMDF